MLEKGHNIIVEERLYGEEFSFITFTDGYTCFRLSTNTRF